MESLSDHKMYHCCDNIIQSLLAQLFVAITATMDSLLLPLNSLVCLGRARQSQRSCTSVHDVSRHGPAGSHAPDHTRDGAAGVHHVPELSGTGPEDQPQGPLQGLRWPKNHTAEEDPGGSC